MKIFMVRGIVMGLIPVIAALTGIIGVLIGNYLSHQSQRDKWLLECRTEAFARFLELIERAHSEATDVIHDKTIEEDAIRGIELFNTYQPVLIQEKIVRLYLSKEYRLEFSELVKEYWILHSSPNLGHKRFSTMDKKLTRIQEIFEHHLPDEFWTKKFIFF